MPKRKTSAGSLLKSFKFIRTAKRKGNNGDATDYLMSNPANRAILEEAIHDVEAKRNIIVRDLIDL